MSYVPIFARKASDSLRQLEAELQEVVLDAVDLLAAYPELLTSRGILPGYAYDLVHEFGGKRHYIFLSVDKDAVNQRLIINAIGHVARQIE